MSPSIFCDDFSYPEIHCSTSRLLIDTRAALNSLLTSVDYVTIFDGNSFSGAYMNVSQNYSALVLIGWSDRIRSSKVRNFGDRHLLRGLVLWRLPVVVLLQLAVRDPRRLRQLVQLGRTNVGIPLLTHLLHGPVPWNCR